MWVCLVAVQCILTETHVPMLMQQWWLINCADFWCVYGECENFAVLKGHTGAIMELQFSTDGS